VLALLLLANLFDLVGLLVSCVGLPLGVLGYFVWAILRADLTPIEERSFSQLDDLVREVAPLAGAKLTGGEAEAKWIARLVRTHYAGNLPSGRGSRVEFHSEHHEEWTTTWVKLSVDADEAPAFRISLASAGTRVARFLGWKQGVEIGKKTFDERFVLETHDPERASGALREQPALRDAIARALALGTSPALEVAAGKVTFTDELKHLRPEKYGKALEALEGVARCFDRVPFEAPGFVAKTLAVVDVSGKTRCPYCHAGVDVHEDLVACEACATVLHSDCWEELGGCPIMGCGGARPERRRARA
jgi:hypothetical protein